MEPLPPISITKSNRRWIWSRHILPSPSEKRSTSYVRPSSSWRPRFVIVFFLPKHITIQIQVVENENQLLRQYAPAEVVNNLATLVAQQKAQNGPSTTPSAIATASAIAAKVCCLSHLDLVSSIGSKRAIPYLIS